MNTLMKPSQTHLQKLLVVALALLGLFCVVQTAVAGDDRPNILFVIVDDQSPFDLKVYNPRSILQTPNIDRLAAEGMVFDAAYQIGSWAGGVCTASRHMIMSGRTLWHIPNKPGRANNPHISNPKLVPSDLAQYTVPAVFNHSDKATLPPSNAKQPALPINYLPAHPFNNTHMTVRDEVNVSGVWKNRDQRTIRNELEREFACSENIDIQMGRVIDKLEAMGELNNTYIFYTADHGMAIGSCSSATRREMGSDKRNLTDFADIAPTLLDMVGIAQPTDVAFDGESQLPVLTGTTDKHRQWIYAYTGPVQVFRTQTHLLEARSPFYGKPNGRFYVTGDSRFGRGYERVDDHSEHQQQRAAFEEIIHSLPSHLEKDHPFWTSKLDVRWLEINTDLEAIAQPFWPASGKCSRMQSGHRLCVKLTSARVAMKDSIGCQAFRSFGSPASWRIFLQYPQMGRKPLSTWVRLSSSSACSSARSCSERRSRSRLESA